jgi:hypothetical protein
MAPVATTVPSFGFPEAIQYSSQVVGPAMSPELAPLHTVALTSTQSPAQPAVNVNELPSHAVGVGVGEPGVAVGVSVAVAVGVTVLVTVGVNVTVAVGVAVPVAVGVSVGGGVPPGDVGRGPPGVIVGIGVGVGV